MPCYRMTGAVSLTQRGASWQAALSPCAGARGAASGLSTGFGCRQEGSVLPGPAARPATSTSAGAHLVLHTSCFTPRASRSRCTPWGQQVAQATELLQPPASTASEKAVPAGIASRSATSWGAEPAADHGTSGRVGRSPQPGAERPVLAFGRVSGAGGRGPAAMALCPLQSPRQPAPRPHSPPQRRARGLPAEIAVFPAQRKAGLGLRQHSGQGLDSGDEQNTRARAKRSSAPR